MKTNIVKVSAGILALAICLGLTARTFAGGQGGGALEQLGITSDVKNKEMAAPKPERFIPAGKAVQRDVFAEIPACKALDRTFIMRPVMADALKMLAPCMKGVSKLYGNNVYAESTIMNPDNIQIVVLDSVSGKTIVEDLKAALAKRSGGLFGRVVTLSVMDVSYKAVAAGSFVGYESGQGCPRWCHWHNADGPHPGTGGGLPEPWYHCPTPQPGPHPGTGGDLPGSGF